MITDFQQAGDKPQQTDLLFTHKQLKLESHQLVWLDDNNEEQAKIISLLQKLRKTFDYTYYSISPVQCSEYIEKNTITTQLVVCSTKLAELLLSRVHNFTHIDLVYIYFTPSESEKNRLQELSVKYSKVI
jgi:hypothetical protein